MKLLASLLTLLLLACGPEPEPILLRDSPGDAMPDVVVIVWDDVSAFDVERVPTPQFDALAAQGARCDRAYAQPWCSPSRMSMLFSIWRGIGVGPTCSAGSTPLDPDTDHLPGMMAAAGYETHLVGKWHLGGHFAGGPWEEAPQLFFDHWHGGVGEQVNSCLPPPASYTRWLRVDDGVSSVEFGYHTTVMADEFRALWAARTEPTLAVVCVCAAHAPFHIPPNSSLPPLTRIPLQATDRERFELMIQSADWELGRMLEVIDLETTVVIVVGDNGTPQFVPTPGRNPLSTKHTTLEGGVRVPMAISAPGLGPMVVPEPVHLVDVLPTIASLAGVAPSWSPEGSSLVPALMGGEMGRGWVWCQRRPGHATKEDLAVIQERWKLRRKAGVEQLFDLLADPEELTALDPDDPEYAAQVAELRGIMVSLQP